MTNLACIDVHVWISSCWACSHKSNSRLWNLVIFRCNFIHNTTVMHCCKATNTQRKLIRSKVLMPLTADLALWAIMTFLLAGNTLKLSLSHVTFICPSCISITNCDLTKKFILFDYLYRCLALTYLCLSTHGGSSSYPSSSSSSIIDEAQRIGVDEASRVLIILGVHEFAPFNAQTINIDNKTQKSSQRTLNLPL